MNIRTYPNHRIYIKTLQAMSAEKRMLKAFELSEFSKQLFIDGLHKSFPDLSPMQLRQKMFERFYGQDFTSDQIRKIKAALADYSGTSR